MASNWQRWMPFHIDRFRGSPAVQAMHPAARAGFIYLLAAAWQTDDCSLPDDDAELAILSGLGELWREHAEPIRRKFHLEQGKLKNDVLTMEWSSARHTFESRKKAAEKTNVERRPRTNSRNNAGSNGHRNGNRDGDRDTYTHTETGTERLNTKAQAPFCRPSWIPEEPWAGYEEMRQRVRKPMTDRARAMAVATLDRLRAAGEDPAAVLEQSIFNSWQGLFAVQDRERTGTRSQQSRRPREIRVQPIDAAREIIRRLEGVPGVAFQRERDPLKLVAIARAQGWIEEFAIEEDALRQAIICDQQEMAAGRPPIKGAIQ